MQTSRTDPLGHVTTYAYDGAGNLTTETDPLGRVTTSTYDTNGNRLSQTTTRTTAVGVETLVTAYAYDGLNRLVQTTHPDGSITRVVYNQIGKQSATVDQLDRQTTYVYDDMGRLVQTTYPDGTSEASTYDAEGRRIASLDRAGRTTTFRYDALGRLIETTYPDGATTTTTYDLIGQVVGTTDPLGHVTQYAYDAAGRRTHVTDALNQVTTFTYDDSGNQLTVTDANGHTTTYTYDGNNRRTQVRYPDGTVETTAYDALGRTVSKTDQAGKTTQFAYDALGRLLQVTDALGQVTAYTYDEAGNQRTQTDANGHTTRFAYDALGRRTTRTLPLGMTETYAYDAAGNQIRKTDFAGKTTSYAYDSVNRLLSKTPDPSLGEPTVRFTYTPTGQRATMVDASGTTTYTYDARDRLRSKATPQGTLMYTYDLAGTLRSINSSNANGVSVAYDYDALNRLVTVTDNRLTNGVTTYSYDPVGNLASYVYPNGVESRYTYNALNRLTTLTISNVSPLASYTYTLGPAGNRTAVTELNGRTVTYTYDDLYRLTNETISGDQAGNNGAISYSYDPVGNRRTRTSTVAAVPDQTLTYDANDRLTSDTYDDNGNTTGSGGTTYAYDFENHLTEQNGGEVTIVYDGDGNRFAKTVGGVTTQYLVDDRNPTGYAQVLEEIENGNVTRRYTYGLKLISQSQSAGVSFYGYDGHGSVRYLMDSSGTVTDTYAYDAFGNLLYSTGTTPNVYLYAGEQHDSSVGFYFLRSRYYEPQKGRFTVLDSFEGVLTDPTSLHKYVYVSSEPVNHIDPSGKFGLPTAIATVTILSIMSVALPTSVRAGDTTGGAAWPHVKVSWEPADEFNFRKWILSNYQEYLGQAVDCADVAVTFLIDYASAVGLPVRLNGRQTPMDSSKTRFKTKAKFLERAKQWEIDAETVHNKNTRSRGALPAGQANARIGDLIIGLCEGCRTQSTGQRFTGHTQIVVYSAAGNVQVVQGHLDGGGGVELFPGPGLAINGENNARVFSGFTTPPSVRWWNPNVFGR